MTKYIVDLYLDGYPTQEEQDAAAPGFIYDQLNFAGSGVKVERYSDWISVGERLPALEDGSRYGSVNTLIWDSVMIQYGYYDYGREAWTCFVRGSGEPYLIYHGVTHWMLLPTPPTP